MHLTLSIPAKCLLMLFVYSLPISHLSSFHLVLAILHLVCPSAQLIVQVFFCTSDIIDSSMAAVHKDYKQPILVSLRILFRYA